jgi:outer membrane protein
MNAKFYSCLSPVSIALGLLFCGNVSAQNLDSVYQSALAYDATVASAKAQFEANLAKGDQAKAAILPTIGFNAGQTRNQTSTTPDGGKTLDKSFGARNIGVSLNQPLYRPANWASYNQGKKQLELAHAAWKAAEQDLIIRVTQAYFDLLAAQESVVYIKAQKAAITEQLASAKRNFEVGTATITDTREAQARFDLTTAQEVVALNDVQIKRLALENVSGVSNIEPKNLKLPVQLPNVKVAEMQSWVDTAVANHPSIIQAKLALEVAELELDKANAAHKPTLDLTASYGRNETPTGGASSNVGSSSTSATIGLSFNMPLFAGFAHQNKIKESSALLDKAKADLSLATRGVSLAVRSSFLGLMASNAQTNALQAAETSSQSALDANKLGYQVGVRINIDVLNSQSQLYQTKRDLAKARFDTLLANLKLKQASGQLTAADVQSINSLLE